MIGRAQTAIGTSRRAEPVAAAVRLVARSRYRPSAPQSGRAHVEHCPASADHDLRSPSQRVATSALTAAQTGGSVFNRHDGGPISTGLDMQGPGATTSLLRSPSGLAPQTVRAGCGLDSPRVRDDMWLLAALSVDRRHLLAGVGLTPRVPQGPGWYWSRVVLAVGRLSAPSCPIGPVCGKAAAWLRGTPDVASDQRAWSARLLAAEMWASLAIVAIWAVSATGAVWGPDFVSTSGSEATTTTIPPGIAAAAFTSIGT